MPLPLFLSPLQFRAIAQGDANVAGLLNANLRAPQTTPAVAITAGASPYTFQNTTNFLQQVVISGGTVSAVSLSRGGVTGEISGTYLLAPGDAMTVTYSVAPTVFNVANIY